MLTRNNQPIQFINEEELKDMMKHGYRYIQEEYLVWINEDEPPDDIWQNKIVKIKEE